MPTAEELIKMDSEEVEDISEEKGEKNSELELEQVRVLVNGLERLADKYIEYKKSMFSEEKDLELTKHKYWVAVTLGITALVGVVLIMIFLLSSRQAMSSEGVSFLLGTIVGYLFSTLTMVINGLLKPNSSKD
ncbi:hypothetical protein [Thermococcus sp.]